MGSGPLSSSWNYEDGVSVGTFSYDIGTFPPTVGTFSSTGGTFPSVVSTCPCAVGTFLLIDSLCRSYIRI